MLPAKKLQLFFDSPTRTMLTQLCHAYKKRPADLVTLLVQGAYLGFQEAQSERQGAGPAVGDQGDQGPEPGPVDPTVEANDPA